MRNFKSASAHALLYSSILASGLLLVNGATVTKSYAAACTATFTIDGANGTACVFGSSAATLTYVASGAYVAGGDFALVLVNHDVTAAAGNGITFSGLTGGDNGFITLTTDSDVVSGAGGDGINAFSSTGNITIDVLDTSSVAGAVDGIDASTTFTGNVTVNTAAGTTVTGAAGDGINANATSSGNVTVNALGTVTGTGGNGIDANASNGTVSVTTGTAAVTGTAGDGIQASASSDVTVVTGGNVSGSGDGIDADSSSGNVTVNTAAGTTVTGTAEDGIDADSSFGNVTVNALGTVTGGVNGINADAFFGGGDVSVTTGTAAVTGGTGDGIQATGGTGGTGGDASVTANGSVSGGMDGIDATGGFGATTGGDATVITTDNSTGGQTISGGTGDGIQATGGFGGTFGGDASVMVTDNSTFGTTVTGGVNGISATGGDAGGTFSGGAGTVTVTDNSTFGATVTGGVNGIAATGGDSATGGNATVTITDNSTFGTTVTGGVNGITATGGDGSTFGGGDATVTITDNSTFGTTVTGTTGAGILAAGGAGGGDVTVTNNGATVQGFTAGIDAISTTGSIITINNGTFGLIQNLSGLDSDLAIRTMGGDTTINNSTFGGTITGRLELAGAGTNTLNNGGTWNTDGTSDFGFGGGLDTVNNTSSGVINAGNNAGVANTTSFVGLNSLNNSGNISLSDQGSGDGSNISDRLETDGDYTGIGGNLTVDAFLGGLGSVADVFAVGGDTFGTTSIVVNNTNPGGGGLNAGILVVDVTGVASAGDFALAGGPIDAGFFVYSLVFNNTSQANDQFLLVSAPDSEFFETTATVAGAQEIWRETASAWETRQNAIRDKLAGGAVVNAVADPSTPEAVADNGLWLTALGSWTNRDDEAGGFDLSYEQDILGVVGGADFGTGLGSGGTLLFGVLAGYVDSGLDFDDSSTSIDYNGATLGAYANWMGGGFFLNVLGKVDLLQMDYSTSVGDDDTDVTSYGGRADLGYRFGADRMFLEPMVSVDAISTKIDKFTIGGVDVDAGTNESLRGGAGLRAGFGGEMVRMSATGRVWEAFDNNIEVDVAGLGVSDDRLEGTYGEAAAQVDVDVSTSMMLFLKGSVLFSNDITKPAVSGGFNWSW